MFIQIKSSNKYKSSQLLVLTGSILAIYEALLQEISSMFHFQHRVVRCEVGELMLNNSHGNYEAPLYLTKDNHTNKEKGVTYMEHRIY